MASHQRTPATVLDPGHRTFEVIHANRHLNRAQRRHEVPLRFRNGDLVNHTVFVPKHLQRKGYNQPYVKPVVDVTEEAAA